MQLLYKIWKKNFGRRPLITFNTWGAALKNLLHAGRAKRLENLYREWEEKYGIEKSGERQIGTMDMIEIGHVQRYEKAVELLTAYEHSPLRNILDCACTVGYGSKIIAQNFPEAKVTGVDIEEKAINFARDHYKGDNLQFVACDALTLDIAEASLDAIVSIETIEHVPDSVALLHKFASMMQEGGVLIGSVPNEDVIPWATNGNIYHYRHFRPHEIRDMLEQQGFEVLTMFAQEKNEKHESKFIEGCDGFSILFAARRSSTMHENR